MDLENIAVGLYSPLKGPLVKNDFDSVVSKGRLSNDVPWTIPILLDVHEEEASMFDQGDSIALSCEGENFAILKVADKYSWVKKAYCQNIYKTTDKEHPGVQKTQMMKPILVRVVNEDILPLLPRIKHETLLIWGEKDAETPPEMARKMNAGLSGSRLEIIKGAGHYAFADEPETFYNLVDSFLRSGG